MCALALLMLLVVVLMYANGSFLIEARWPTVLRTEGTNSSRPGRALPPNGTVGQRGRGEGEPSHGYSEDRLKSRAHGTPYANPAEMGIALPEIPSRSTVDGASGLERSSQPVVEVEGQAPIALGQGQRIGANRVPFGAHVDDSGSSRAHATGIQTSPSRSTAIDHDGDHDGLSVGLHAPRPPAAASGAPMAGGSSVLASGLGAGLGDSQGGDSEAMRTDADGALSSPVPHAVARDAGADDGRQGQDQGSGQHRGRPFPVSTREGRGSELDGSMAGGNNSARKRRSVEGRRRERRASREMEMAMHMDGSVLVYGWGRSGGADATGGDRGRDMDIPVLRFTWAGCVLTAVHAVVLLGSIGVIILVGVVVWGGIGLGFAVESGPDPAANVSATNDDAESVTRTGTGSNSSEEDEDRSAGLASCPTVNTQTGYLGAIAVLEILAMASVAAAAAAMTRSLQQGAAQDEAPSASGQLALASRSPPDARAGGALARTSTSGYYGGVPAGICCNPFVWLGCVLPDVVFSQAQVVPSDEALSPHVQRGTPRSQQ